jgi:hypothetical protein
MDFTQLKQIKDSNEIPKYKLQKDHKLQLPSIKKSISLIHNSLNETDNSEDKLEVNKD